jgi:hypothetical protein
MRKELNKMKNFTNITRIAALAAMAAIGISLYACEKKEEKAAKPTEAAEQAAAEAEQAPQETPEPAAEEEPDAEEEERLARIAACEAEERSKAVEASVPEEQPKYIFGTPIDINNIPFGAGIETVKKTYGLEFESIIIDGNLLFRAIGTFKNKFAFGFTDNKLERVVIFRDYYHEIIEEASRLCEKSAVSVREGGFRTWDYKGKLLVDYESSKVVYRGGDSILSGGFTIYQGYAKCLQIWGTKIGASMFGASIEEVKKAIPDIDIKEMIENPELPELTKLLSVGVRMFCDDGEDGFEICYNFYQGKLYLISDHNGYITDPDVEATIENLLAEKKEDQ